MDVERALTIVDYLRRLFPKMDFSQTMVAEHWVPALGMLDEAFFRRALALYLNNTRNTQPPSLNELLEYYDQAALEKRTAERQSERTSAPLNYGALLPHPPAGDLWAKTWCELVIQGFMERGREREAIAHIQKLCEEYPEQASRWQRPLRQFEELETVANDRTAWLALSSQG